MTAMSNGKAWAAALCAGLTGLAACSSDSNFVKPGYDFRTVGTIAVFVTMNAGAPEQQQAVADLFARQLRQQGYDVAPRAALADLGGQAAFRSVAGITGPEGRAALAARKISAVVAVNIHMPAGEHWRAREGYADEDEMVVRMEARMLDAQTGAPLWGGEAEGVMPIEMAISGSAWLDTGATPAPEIGPARAPAIGGSAGAPTGGDADAILKPDMARFLRSVIEKTCADLPARTS
jgi:hypothetical protein